MFGIWNINPVSRFYSKVVNMSVKNKYFQRFLSQDKDKRVCTKTQVWLSKIWHLNNFANHALINCNFSASRLCLRSGNWFPRCILIMESSLKKTSSRYWRTISFNNFTSIFTLKKKAALAKPCSFSGWNLGQSMIPMISLTFKLSVWTLLTC